MKVLAVVVYQFTKAPAPSSPLLRGVEESGRFLFVMRGRRSVLVLIALVLVYWVFPRSTYAYLDPGTGSYIIQVAIATLAGGTYLIFAFWGKIKTFLGKFLSKFIKRKENVPRR